MIRFRIIVIILLLSASVSAVADDRFVSKLHLPTGQTVVVAEGDLEARSIGSFSVRLYEAAETLDETTFFISGLIHPRDGVVEKITLANIDGHKQPSIIVIVRSVGTGSYLSVYAFEFTKDKLVFRAAVEGLAPDKDPIASLRNSKCKQE